MEVIKTGGHAITSDSNLIANLICKARFTFLNFDSRMDLRSLDESVLTNMEPLAKPQVEGIDKWWDPKTQNELCKIKNYIECYPNLKMKSFLQVCFSAILTSCSGRNGKHFAYFADNTPLPKDQIKPEYQNAIKKFTTKVKTNLSIIDRFYALLERNDMNPEVVLERIKVLQVDATKGTPKDYEILPNTIDGIVTSPPYLCMTDYSYGNRLSYYWIALDSMNKDFENEIGARRNRTNPKKVFSNYLIQMNQFAENMSNLLRRDGFLSVVIAPPNAKAFTEMNIDLLDELDKIFILKGFRKIWEVWRPLHWQVHTFSRTKKERISVYLLQ